MKSNTGAIGVTGLFNRHISLILARDRALCKELRQAFGAGNLPGQPSCLIKE
jgi:hypothetical protein